MRGHCKPDFDTKVTEFAMYLRQETPSDVNSESDAVLSKDEEELLRKFGKFLEMDRRGKYSFGRHGHHGKFGHGHGHGHFHGHGMHGHHGHHVKHDHYGKHGHCHGKQGQSQDLKRIFEDLSELQKKLAASMSDARSKCDSERRHWGRHRSWKIGQCRRRWNSTPATQNQNAEPEGGNEREATQNLAAMVETIDLEKSP